VLVLSILVKCWRLAINPPAQPAFLYPSVHFLSAGSTLDLKKSRHKKLGAFFKVGAPVLYPGWHHAWSKENE